MDIIVVFWSMHIFNRHKKQKRSFAMVILHIKSNKFAEFDIFLDDYGSMSISKTQR